MAGTYCGLQDRIFNCEAAGRNLKNLRSIQTRIGLEQIFSMVRYLVTKMQKVREKQLRSHPTARP
jgi:hypothetical protein